MAALVSSSANSFGGSLDADGFTTTIDPFAPVSGSAPPAYDDTSRIALFDHTYDLTPAEYNTLSLDMQASHMVNNAEMGGIGVDWSDYLKGVSSFQKASTLSDTLWRRLTNLTERGLLAREGNRYAITDTGLSWLKGFADVAAGGSAASSKRTVVIEAARAHNEAQLQAFKARLMQLEAEQFEHFVKELLDAMDYEDVRVTKLTEDKGVDVIAKHQFGITEITEVVQVKRAEG